MSKTKDYLITARIEEWETKAEKTGNPHWWVERMMGLVDPVPGKTNELLHDIKEMQNDPEYVSNDEYIKNEIRILINDSKRTTWKIIRSKGYLLNHLSYSELVYIKDCLAGYKSIPVNSLFKMLKVDI